MQGYGAYGVVIRAEMTVRRDLAGAALECRLPCAVKTLWRVIASPYHIAGLVREVGAALCIVVWCYVQ